MRVTGDWNQVIEIIGFEAAEKLRERFKNENLRVPGKLPKMYIVPLIKAELKENFTYEELGKKYNLTTRTVRNYEKWTIKGNALISPDGREYLKEDPT